MSNAPFYTGQEVISVCSCTNNQGVGFSKGQIFTIKGIFLCKCGEWKVDIGLFRSIQKSCSCNCGDEHFGKTVWANSDAFAPIERKRICYVVVSETLKEQTQELILS